MNPSPKAIEIINRIIELTGDMPDYAEVEMAEIIQAAIDEACEETAEHFRKGLYAKLDEAMAKAESRPAQEDKDTWKKAYDNLLIDYERLRRSVIAILNTKFKVKEAVRENRKAQ